MAEALSADLNAYHRITPRHVLVIEAALTHEQCVKVFAGAEKLRCATNDLTAVLNNRLKQLRRTKRYRSLLRLYGKAKEKGDDKERIRIAREIEDMVSEYGLKKYACYTAMDPIAARHGVNSCVGRGRVDEIYMGLEKCLMNGGEMLHFRKRGELPSIRGQQARRGVSITARNCREKLTLIWEGMKIGVIVKDRFEREEVEKIMHYLKNRDEIDSNAVKDYREKGIITDTFRPCYGVLTPKKIRGRLRVYVTIVIEGKALPKYDRNGEKRHHYGKGVVGVDLGTQSVAIRADSTAYLMNLGERGQSICEREREERRLGRKLDRSQRMMNKENYNPNGTIKKGSKMKKSNNYRKLVDKLVRIRHAASLNRHYAIREAVNKIRALGDVLIIEPKNSSILAMRAKEGGTDSRGRAKRRKRFGKSIQNRCPGYFQEYCQTKFERTGGRYIEVEQTYRASQFDHTSGEYVKRKLSDRMFKLSDGTLVQRDMYSAFLLSNMMDPKTIDREKCIRTFDCFCKDMNAFIDHVKSNRIRIMNSGIRLSPC